MRNGSLNSKNQWLADALTKNGVTQAILAKKWGVSTSIVTRYIRHATHWLTDERIVSISEVTGLTREQIEDLDFRGGVKRESRESLNISPLNTDASLERALAMLKKCLPIGVTANISFHIQGELKPSEMDAQPDESE